MRPLKLALLFMCKWLGGFAIARWLTRRHLKILCYHGFALKNEAVFRPKLFISPQVFENRMDQLRRSGLQVLPLDQAVSQMYEGRLPDHAIVITIDDGFHSVATLAAPVLARHGFPSTVYVTSYYVKHGVPIYRLVVQYMVWKTAVSRLQLAGRAWHPDGDLDLGSPATREAFANRCIRHGEALDDETQRMRICEELGELLGVPFQAIVDERILHLMTPGQLRDLDAQGMNVQLHTHRHRFSPSDKAEAMREIDDNRRHLTEWLPGGSFFHFCYPSGVWEPQQWAWLDELGVRSTTTCLSGLNSAATPRHALYRFLDGDNIHPLEFEAAISGFSDLIKRRM